MVECLCWCVVVVLRGDKATAVLVMMVLQMYGTVGKNSRVVKCGENIRRGGELLIWSVGRVS